MSQPSVIRNVLARLFQTRMKIADAVRRIVDAVGQKAARRTAQRKYSSAARAATRPRDRSEVNCSRDRCEWGTWSLLGPQ
eukprot:7070894-Prymnesium_polylepis.1